MFSDAATGLAGVARVLSHRTAAAHTVRARRSQLAQGAAARSPAQLATTSPTCHGSSTTRTPPTAASLARMVHTRSVDTATARVVCAHRWPSVYTLATDEHAQLAPASQTPATAPPRQPTRLRTPSTHDFACLVACAAATGSRRWFRFRAADGPDSTTSTDSADHAVDTEARQLGGCRPGHRPHVQAASDFGRAPSREALQLVQAQAQAL